METFLECETTCRVPLPGHVFVESLAEIDPRIVAEVVRVVYVTKKTTPLRPIFRALSETHSAISLEMCNRAGNGSMGHGSVGQMGHYFGWVTWVMGQCMLTHDPPLFNHHSKSQENIDRSSQ